MAAMVVFVKGVECDFAGNVLYVGDVCTADLTAEHGPIGFSVTVPIGTSALQSNQAIKDAAVLACQTAGFPVEVPEQKVLIGGNILI